MPSAPNPEGPPGAVRPPIPRAYALADLSTGRLLVLDGCDATRRPGCRGRSPTWFNTPSRLQLAIELFVFLQESVVLPLDLLVRLFDSPIRLFHPP